LRANKTRSNAAFSTLAGVNVNTHPETVGKAPFKARSDQFGYEELQISAAAFMAVVRTV